MSVEFKYPQGPVQPIFEALEDVEVLEGWVASLEDSAAHQLRSLKEKRAAEDRVDDHYDTHHGLIGAIWDLDYMFTDYFPGLQRAAGFLVIWGSFERRITQLCSEVAIADSYQITLNDLHGSGLTRARAYLLKVASLDGEWAEAGWQEFPDFQRIRNLFAHCNGQIEAKHLKEAAYVETSPHLNIRGQDVYLESTFLLHVLSRQRELLNGLYEVALARFGDGN